jgi:hypothetical protein
MEDYDLCIDRPKVFGTYECTALGEGYFIKETESETQRLSVICSVIDHCDNSGEMHIAVAQRHE